MNTTATTTAELLASELTTHEYDTSPHTHQPKGCDAPYTFESLNLGLAGLLIGSVCSDSRGVDTCAYPRPTIEQGAAIRDEIIRRWNAFPKITNALGLIRDIGSTELRHSHAQHGTAPHKVALIANEALEASK